MDWIQEHIPPWFWIAIIVHLVVLGTVAYLILLERKVASWVQDRIGPNRVGLGGLLQVIPGLASLRHMKMFGLGQPLADGLKFFLKEDYRPANADKVLFTLAPMIMITVIIVSIAVIPWGGAKGYSEEVTIPAGSTVADVVGPTLRNHHELLYATRESEHGLEEVNLTQPLTTATNIRYSAGWRFQIADLNIGVLFILATLSLAVYGVVIGGWASNNKYSFLGGLRATANMISYELPLGMSVLAIVIMFGTLSLTEIVDKQVGYWAGFIPQWNVFAQPLTFVMFLICIHAEANRAPFDTAEAEQELVGGYHTEYSSMRFALFFLAEYAGMVTTSALCVALFFGGWHLPGLGGSVHPGHPSVTDSFWLCVLRAVVFFTKTLIVLFIFMWTRWSLPRFRFDQIMSLAWRALIPMSLALLMGTAVIVYFFGGENQVLMRVNGTLAVALLAMNVALVAIFMLASLIVPAARPTNRKISVAGSRFDHTPLPAGTAAAS